MNKLNALFVVVVIYAGMTAYAQSAPTADAPSPLVLEKMGVLFVGGREVPMTVSGGRTGGNGQTQIVEQAPVHYFVPTPSAREGKLPVVMIPGMGLTSYLYLATPDGREGWAQYFARSGHPVYVFDEPNNAISGFDVSQFNAGEDGQEQSGSARFMLWSNETVWRRWGIGPSPGVPFEDTRFPFEHIKQLYASMTPVFMGTSRPSASEPEASQSGTVRGRRGRLSRMQTEQPGAQASTGARAGGMRGGSSAKVAALIELLEKTGPAVLIIHSASASTGLEVVRQRPELVAMVVAIEIVGSPTDSEDVEEGLSKIPFLGLFGDHFEERRMSGRYEACKKTAELIAESGGKAEVIRLPDFGIKGNTHLMMQDNNNDAIAKIILQRIPEE